MLTAPKLTYAKIGNKSKNKIEPSSTQLVRNQQQKSQDLFSHMNQQNLNYIKKQLKLKKNRSQQDRSKVNKQDDHEQLENQITQRQKIYHKYKGQQQVSERQPYLEETERKSSQEKPLDIQLSQQSPQDDAILNEVQHKRFDQKKQLSTSQKQQPKNFQKNVENKMYQSLPYEQPKRRVVSIEGYFKESVSANLQKNKVQGGNFIQFLQDYISDLNQSKHLKSKTHQQNSIDKKQQIERQQKVHKYTTQSIKNKYNKESSQEQQRIKQQYKKIEKMKRNSDTFGQPNSKYTVHSSASYESTDLQTRLKRQQLSCIMLAKQIEALREALIDKDKIIKKYKLNNELLLEEITHLKTQQQIIMKNKNQFLDTKANKSQKHTKKSNIENMAQDYQQNLNHFVLSHQRHGSVNQSMNSRNGYSYRGNTDLNQPLFQQFAPPNKYREKQRTPKKINRSVEKLQKQLAQFLQQSVYNIKRGQKKFRPDYY